MGACVGLVRVRGRATTEQNRKIGGVESTWAGRLMQLGLLEGKGGGGKGAEPPDPSSIALMRVLPKLLLLLLLLSKLQVRTASVEATTEERVGRRGDGKAPLCKSEGLRGRPVFLRFLPMGGIHG